VPGVYNNIREIIYNVLSNDGCARWCEKTNVGGFLWLCQYTIIYYIKLGKTQLSPAES